MANFSARGFISFLIIKFTVFYVTWESTESVEQCRGTKCCTGTESIGELFIRVNGSSPCSSLITRKNSVYVSLRRLRKEMFAVIMELRAKQR